MKIIESQKEKELRTFFSGECMYKSDFLALSPLSKVHMLITLEGLTSTKDHNTIRKRKGSRKRRGRGGGGRRSKGKPTNTQNILHIATSDSTRTGGKSSEMKTYACPTFSGLCPS